MGDDQYKCPAYCIESRNGGTVAVETTCGFEPLQEEIRNDPTITELLVSGDRFWTMPSHDKRLGKTHIGSAGWPPNLKKLDLVDTYNLDIVDLNVPTLETLTIPLISNIFGEWIDRDNELARQRGDDEPWSISILPNRFGDSTVGSIQLQFMPKLTTIYLRDGVHTGLLQFAHRWLDYDLSFNDGEKIDTNMVAWLQEHPIWTAYTQRGYTIKVLDLTENLGCTIRIVKRE